MAEQVGLAIGATTVALSFLILLAWVPLRQRPGLGTVANAVVVGVAIDLTLRVLGDGGGPLSEIELSVCAAGVALGGTFGLGTLAFALLIGPGVQLALGQLGVADL